MKNAKRLRRLGDAWCNQHERYEVVYADSFIPGTTIPHDPHKVSPQNARRKDSDTLTRATVRR